MVPNVWWHEYSPIVGLTFGGASAQARLSVVWDAVVRLLQLALYQERRETGSGNVRKEAWRNVAHVRREHCRTTAGPVHSEAVTYL